MGGEICVLRLHVKAASPSQIDDGAVFATFCCRQGASSLHIAGLLYVKYNIHIPMYMYLHT